MCLESIPAQHQRLSEMFYNEFFFQTKPRYNALFIDLIFALGIEAVEEKDDGFYVRSNESLQNLAFALEIFRQNLSKKLNTQIPLKTSLTKKPNKDWINEYKKAIKPLQIGDFYIHSSWQKARENLTNIQIDPALAFGSGHHESTHSCILLLQKYAKKGFRALDVGCGSGILSIILAKMGCEIYACDVDEMAIKSAKSNAKLNGVKFKEIWLGSVNSRDFNEKFGDALLRENLQGEKFDDASLRENLQGENSCLNLKEKSNKNLVENSAKSPKKSHPQHNIQKIAKKTQLPLKSLPCDTMTRAVNLISKQNEISHTNLAKNSHSKSINKFDLIVANLTFEVINSIQNELKNSLKNGGILVLSGILERHEKQIEEIFKNENFTQDFLPNFEQNALNSRQNSTNLRQNYLNLNQNSTNFTRKNSKNLILNRKILNSQKSENFTQKDKVKINEWLSFVYVKDEK